MPGTPIGAAGTESATRVAALLLLFISGQRTWGVTGIARELELSKAVVHRMLQALVAKDLVVQDAHTREYSLGPAAVALGAAGMRSSDLRRAARPVLRELRNLTNETVTLSSLVGTQRVYLDQYTSRREIKLTVELGRLFPLTAGSSGRVILAHIPQEQREHVLRTELPKLTQHTPSDADALRSDCLHTREVGYAVSTEERQSGAASIASAVFDLDGEVVGAISLCGPADRLSLDLLQSRAGVLLEHAQRISAELGHQGVGNTGSQQPREATR